jgi:hypothetical protein
MGGVVIDRVDAVGRLREWSMSEKQIPDHESADVVSLIDSLPEQDCGQGMQDVGSVVSATAANSPACFWCAPIGELS